ncbi:tyrosine-protein kinase [Williamwhitmania taraxaci]|uniref:non-specific protein-tyrosine kinase n=1 Tax=Williamwhitmania taraxaci TaxID=1640674 RepID=A0A1G6GGI2_9BACT|nr:tyrosine-protein kinase [Williamwhitmania taraxaci]SDB81097.1 protein involved in gliding motility EpsB [Williamwhitmania taraxaci]
MESIPNNDRPISTHGFTPEEEQLDIKRLLFRVIANWYWFAITVFAGLFIAYLVNRYSEQVYNVSASLIVKDDDNSKAFTGAENMIQSLRLVKNTKSIQNEIGVLQSYSMAYQVVKELDEFRVTYVLVGRRGIKESRLYQSAPFKVLIDTTGRNIPNYPVYVKMISNERYLLEIDDGMGVKQEMRFGELFKNSAFCFRIQRLQNFSGSDNNLGVRYYFKVNSINALANTYKGKVSISLNDKKGSILTLSSSGFVAEQEAAYLNKLMEVYIRKGLEDKNKIAANTVNFIDSQLDNMTDSLRRAEQRLQDFRSNNRVINISREGEILFGRIREFQIDQGAFELKGRYYAYLKKYLSSRSDLNQLVAPSAMGVDDTQLSSLLGEISQTYIAREEMRASVKNGNPGLEQLNIRLENLRNSLTEKVESLIAVNKVAQEDVLQRLNKVEGEIVKLPGNERQLIGFEREFNLLEKMYNYLQEKRAEAAIAKASNIADNKVLDYAMPENASIIKPKRSFNYLIGMFIGALLPLAFIFLLDFFNDKLTDIKEIASKTTVPVIGTMGHNRYEAEIPVISKPKSTLAESFRGLRTNLQYLLRNPEQKVIAVTSTLSSEGKTFTAVNLAAIMAMAGNRVLLMGLDLRKPKIQKMLNVVYSEGISTYLIGKSTLEQVVKNTPTPNLFFAPSGPIPPNPSELLGSQKMDEFMNWAREHYDYIVVDTPPVAIVTDALLIARFADANLFVVRFGYSSKEVLKLVEDIYKHKEIRNLAIVVNDFQPKRGYGYGYTYKYSYGYSYSYSYGYGNKDKSGYYSDEDEPKLTFKEQVKRWF